MAATQRTTAYACPDCAGSIVFDEQFWQCEECEYVPNHSAD